MNTKATTDGLPPDPGLENASAPKPIDPVTGQHGAYFVLSEEERKNGWLRPYRDSYIHNKCGALTKMGRALAETYAKNPHFYGATFCTGCRNHFSVSEFTWDGIKDKVGS